LIEEKKKIKNKKRKLLLLSQPIHITSYSRAPCNVYTSDGEGGPSSSPLARQKSTLGGINFQGAARGEESVGFSRRAN
jgi:hypothetical protein